MTRLSVTDRDGVQTTVEAPAGQSAMEATRSAGVGQMLAICGGMCACATCHVYVAPECLEFLPPMGSDETSCSPRCHTVARTLAWPVKSAWNPPFPL